MVSPYIPPSPCQKWMDEALSSVFAASKGVVQQISLTFVQWQ